VIGELFTPFSVCEKKINFEYVHVSINFSFIFDFRKEHENGKST